MLITKHSGIYSFTVKQQLPLTIEKAWDFFSTPDNLAKITPAEMGFHITSKKGLKMFEGQIITYKIGILPFVKANWVTEITHVKENDYFIDEQRFGPYNMWHHQHQFTSNATGVEMVDTVHFKLPFGCIGTIAYHLFIKKQLTTIFNHRRATLEHYFGS
jgi:ligand-binding SRPBCC domain-containing protein